jgi:hypothetical protein
VARLLTADDLLPFARKVLEDEYQSSNRRERCSREDFTAGFMAAVLHFKVRNYFDPEVWAEAHA